MPSIQLSDTSAFVMLLLGNSIHTSQNSQRYMEMLDLTAGQELLKDCTMVWPHLDELVINRKSIILQEVKASIQSGVCQVVIFGSGMDALSIEITSLYDTVQVYEVDSHQMEHKQQLVNEVMQDTRRITCVAVDLNQPSKVISKITDSGWDKNRPSVLVFEGISYYLEHGVLWEIARMFSSHAPNHAIVEYMVPKNMIDARRSHIPDGVFGVIQDKLPQNLKVNRFGHDTAIRHVEAIGGLDIRRHTMSSIEKSRTGANRFFPTKSSGWMEIVCFNIPIHKE